MLNSHLHSPSVLRVTRSLVYLAVLVAAATAKSLAIGVNSAITAR